MLLKSKTNIIYLCLLLISLRLVGCVSVTEEQNTEQTTENVPIIDLNTPKQVLKAPPKIENSDKQQSLDQTPQAKPSIKVQEVQKIPEPVAPIDIYSE